MRDKMKGFVCGVVASVVLLGSTAYATGETSIEGFFKKAKFMIDGVETKSSKMGSVTYKDKLYVPLTLISEATGNRVEWDEKQNTVWIGKKTGRFDALSTLDYARINGAARNHTIKSRTLLKIAGTKYWENGIKVELVKSEEADTTSSGSLEYNLNGKYSRFSGLVGIDDLTKNSVSSGSFKIVADGKERFSIADLRGGDAARQFDVDVTNVKKLELIFSRVGAETVSIDLVHGKLFD
ncbi:hypothetical protein EBB07_26320 [Paenibacillaceae bacterium]|nr:hypothetical protein EBB07_26320 [Paenibacillaceae bacterium]